MLATRRLALFAGALSILTLSATDLHSCQVPVFRYALERWSPGRYQVQILSDGPLEFTASDWLESLKLSIGMTTPIELVSIDVSASADSDVQRTWGKEVSQNSPLIVVQYPERHGSRKPAFVGKLTEGSVESVLDSPVRKEVVKRLTAGESAVWILLKSGDDAKDSKARATLEAQLARDAERLELPSAEELEVDSSVLGNAKVPLQIKFSVIELDRQNEAEQFLIHCLLGSEDDLRDYDSEPIAFPIFGRGIVLYALVGAGISPEVVAAASKFIVGPCSCQVKEQNPGFDLLLNCDWDSLIGNTLISSPIPASDSPPRLLTIPPGKANK